MAVRLLKLGRSCSVSIMKDFVHGFCNMDTNGLVGVAEYRRATNITIGHFRSMFAQILTLDESSNENAVRNPNPDYFAGGVPQVQRPMTATTRGIVLQNAFADQEAPPQ